MKRKNKFIKIFISYLKPYVFLYVFSMIVMFISTIFSIVHPYIAAQLIDIVIVLGHIEKLTFFVVLFIGVLILSGILAILQTYLFTLLGNKIILNLKKNIFFKIQTLQLDEFYKTRIGDLMVRMSSDAEVLQTFLTQTIAKVFIDFIMLIGILVIMLKMNMLITTVFLVTIPFFIFSQVYFSPKIRELNFNIRNKVGSLISFIQNVLANIMLVKSYKKEEYNKQKFVNYYTDLIRVKIRVAILMAIAMWSNSFIGSFGNILIIWLSAHQIVKGNMSIGGLVALTTYSNMVLGSIQRLAQINLNFQQVRVSMERIIEIFDYKDESNKGKDINFSKRIDFNNASFSFNGKNDILNDIELHITFGEKILIYGKSGIGKSTLVNLLLGFYNNYTGDILIDGVQLREISKHSLRRQISIVLQDNYVFNDSLFNNIVLGEQYSLEEVKSITKITQLHDEIETFDNKYDTLIGEGGLNLSGGQKQRLALSRALIRKPKVLILDESTSGLNTDMEKNILDRIINEFPLLTIIMISHRQEMLSFFQKKYEIQSSHSNTPGTTS